MAIGKATRAEGRALVYCYVRRDDTSDAFEECECDCLWGAGQRVSYALLSSTRYKTYVSCNPF